ncbi:histone H2B.v3-like [Panonychus citri]|uniref:histone H2B.v3-like n=1 Tax=Panonychus citri TaxID=50023 RepID=UPI002307E458|nr:histone H2B.v3-like [Panonychus citri]
MSNEEASTTTHRRKRNDRSGFVVYLYRMLKSIDEKASINRKAMLCVNGMVCDLLHKIAREASDLVEQTHKHTIQVREIKAATNLLIRGDLNKEVHEQAAEALARFTSGKGGAGKGKSKRKSKKSGHRSKRSNTM